MVPPSRWRSVIEAEKFMLELLFVRQNIRILFLGPAGSGKGTQSAKLAEKYGIPHISTGDLIRSEIKSASDLGKKVKSIVEAGQLVSDDIVNEIVKSKLEKSDSFILDGYPRTLEQAKFFAEYSSFDFVFNLTVPREQLIRRLTGRRMCSKEQDPNCKGNYHVELNPPREEGICDLCSSSLYQRKDDQLESIERRLNGYEAETGKPLEEFYSNQIQNFDASQSPEQVFQDLERALDLSQICS